MGKKTGVAQAEVRDQDGNLIAVGMSTHLVCGPEDVRMADEIQTTD
jgi:peptidyl-tRNA hydrolase